MTHVSGCRCVICQSRSLEEGLRRVRNKVRGDISDHGRSCIGVFPADDSEDPLNEAFIYTIGNSLRGLPELFLVGMFNAVGQSILNDVSELLAKSPDPLAERDMDIGGRCPVHLVQANDYVKEAFGIKVDAFIEVQRFDVMQVVLCDVKGRFPWDAGCDKPYSLVKVHRRLQG